MYNKYFATDSVYDPFYFCTKDASTCSSTKNGVNTQINNKDPIYFIYEQDCHYDD